MIRKKVIRPLLGLLLVCALIVPLLATPVLANGAFPLETDDEVITDALDYLASVQDPASGAIGSYSDSAWATIAIAAAGEDPNEFGDPSVVDYLKDNAAEQAWEYNPVTGLARVILAAVAACEDPAAFGSGDPTCVPDGDYVAALKSYYSEAEGQFVYEGCLEYDSVTWECLAYGTVTDTINDDFWGLMALIAAGEPQDSTMVTSVAAFIEANQGFDGGWSYATPTSSTYYGSDNDDTAAALMALAAAGGASDSYIVDMAVAFMQYNQGLSGGFMYDSYSAESLASTVWAVDAIVASGQNPTAAEWTTDANPVDFIMSYRQADGSFLDSGAWSPNPVRDTADSVISLTGNFYPVIPQCAEYVFEDPRRGTKLIIIDSQEGTFRFTAPDGYDSGVVEARFMRVKHGRITIYHFDSSMWFTCQINVNRDFCTGLMAVKASKWHYKHYIIRDPRGFE